MKKFGFLSFGHYGEAPGSLTPDAEAMLKQTLELAIAADEIGVNGAYLRVHHWAKQLATPWPLLTAMAVKTKNIEVGTGVIDMRYENPFQMAEEAATLEILADGRVALGVSRGSPETANRGYETWGYTGSTDPRGADIAREHFDKFWRAINGEPMAEADTGHYAQQYGIKPGKLPIEPRSKTLPSKIWWGAGSRESAENVGRMGLNMMSSTLVGEATGQAFADLQAEQIDRFRAAYKEAGHAGEPRVSVSRSIFPIITEQDNRYFGLEGQASRDQIGIIDGLQATFGKTYADSPESLVEALKNDAAVMSADTLMLTIPNQLGVDYNLHVLESFAKYVAPELGWEPANKDN